MKLLIAFSILLFAWIAAAAPAKNSDHDQSKEIKELIKKSKELYHGNHDIVSILVPINGLNFYTDGSKPSTNLTIFFVEADIDNDGKRTYKGLYVFKEGKATKILENGKDAAASADNSNQIFFAAEDGIYEYNYNTNEAVKYGSVTDNIIGIAKTNNSDIIYILTQDHELYKVTDKGNTKTKVEEVVNAQEIVLDYSNNIYFYAEDKKPYVLANTGLKSFEGLPTNSTNAKLIKPPFFIQDGVLLILDNAAYIIYANGSKIHHNDFKQPNAKLTAWAMEAFLIDYFAYDKKIYEFNLLKIIIDDIFNQFSNWLEEKICSTFSCHEETKHN